MKISHLFLSMKYAYVKVCLSYCLCFLSRSYHTIEMSSVQGLVHFMGWCIAMFFGDRRRKSLSSYPSSIQFLNLSFFEIPFLLLAANWIHLQYWVAHQTLFIRHFVASNIYRALVFCTFYKFTSFHQYNWFLSAMEFAVRSKSSSLLICPYSTLLERVCSYQASHF